MIAKSFSSLALILLLFISVCSAQPTVGYYDSPYIHTTSRVGNPTRRLIKRPGPPTPNRMTSQRPPRRPTTTTPIRTTSPTAPNAGGPTSRPTTAPSNQTEPVQAPFPALNYLSRYKVIAEWEANVNLSRGTKVEEGIYNLRGWDKMLKDLKKAGRPKTERTRCHMIAKSLGGEGKPFNLFACFQYFNNNTMVYFEDLMRTQIKSLRGKQKCGMTVSVQFTGAAENYARSVNMDAKCKGSQFFNVNIFNKLQKSEARIDHLCRPTVALGPPRFPGTATLIPGASAC